MNHRLRHLLSKPNLYGLTRLLSSPISSDPTRFPIPPISIPRPYHRQFHSSLYLSSAQAQPQPELDTEDDAAMNQFLSRFVHAMRPRLTASFPDCDKEAINSMLVLIINKLLAQMNLSDSGSGGFEAVSMADDVGNDELNNTMWEVSKVVFQEMEREKKKEKLKKYLQSEEVNAMARFASEVGVRGDMLRELKFKWAREVMEKAEFYEELNALKEGDQHHEDAIANEDVDGDGESEGVLPARRGKIKYKLYGLDMSGDEWRDVAGKIDEVDDVVWPKEAKEITGKCKVVTEKIVEIKEGDDDGKISELLEEWIQLLKPTRVDWIALLHRIKARRPSVYLKVAERLLDEPSFLADVRDYSQLIDAYAGESQVEDVERLLKKMSEKGFLPDALTLSSLLHMYSKTNKVVQAKEAYETLRSQGFKLDLEIYYSMLMAYINSGQLRSAELLIREMEVKDIRPTEEMYISMLQAFAREGNSDEANRIVTGMQFAGFQPTAESCTLLIEAYAKSKDKSAEDARHHFDYMMKLGYKPDDRSTSLMISAYEKKNELDKALSLFLQLEKDGFQPGMSTYCVLVDWLGKLQLIDEAEQMLTKIAELGETPPFKLQVSLCDMYIRSGVEKKALQFLGVLESKKELLDYSDFSRIMEALAKKGSRNDLMRFKKLMEAQGFTPSDTIQINLIAREIPKYR